MDLSPPLFDGLYDGPHGRQLYGSCFNMAWPRELGIEPRVIIDAGSYDGGDAYRLKTAFPRAYVLAIEADPERFRITQENLANQGIETESCALTDRTARVRWYRGTGRGKVSSSGSIYQMTPEARLRHKQHAYSETVLGSTLSIICGVYDLEHIDILHMDIEGATLPALRGLGTIRPRLIFTEMVDCWIDAPPSADAHAWLVAEGYEQIAQTRGDDRLYLRKAAP